MTGAARFCLPSLNQANADSGEKCSRSVFSLASEQKRNYKREQKTNTREFRAMTEIVQDVFSLVSVSLFIVASAMWIGAF